MSLPCLTLHLQLATGSSFNSPLPTPRPSLAPLGERREPHVAACAALACTHDRSLGFPSMKRCALHALRICPRSWYLDVCLLPPPVGLGRGAQPKTDQDGRLSERSEFEPGPVFGEHRWLPRSAAQGTQTIGSPFLCLLSFGEAKESELPPGNPRLVGKPQTNEAKKAGQAQPERWRRSSDFDPGSSPG